MVSEPSAGMSYRAPDRATGYTARTVIPGDSHKRGNEFEGCATGTGGQIVVSDAMSEFNNEVVIRCENSHRLYEFLFFVHFHRDDYEEGGGTMAVQP
jgi:hypothetical protein